MVNKEQLLFRAEPFLRQGLQGTILLRHAHRVNIPSHSFGNELSITSKGQQAALDWGRALSSLPFEKIESSPVLRCLQTADWLQKGLEKQFSVYPSTLLGNPGTFIADPGEAEKLFTDCSVQEILKNMVAGIHLKGIKPIFTGITHFFNEFLFRKEKLTLLITHDSIMIPICCYLFDSQDIQKYSPDFLEAVLFFYDEDQLFCNFRDEQTITSRTMLKIRD